MNAAIKAVLATTVIVVGLNRYSRRRSHRPLFGLLDFLEAYKDKLKAWAERGISEETT